MKKIAHRIAQQKGRRTNKTVTPQAALAPITGPIGPAATVLSWDEALFNKDAPTGAPMRPIEHLLAERVVLRDEDGAGHDLAGSSLARLFTVGLTGSDDPPEGILESLLCRLQADLDVIGLAADAVEGAAPIASLAAATKQRICVAMELHSRIHRRVAAADSKECAMVVPPAPRDAAAALLLLPGVLSARSTRDRLERIAQMLDMRVLTEGAQVDFWYEKDLEGQRLFPKIDGYKPQSRFFACVPGSGKQSVAIITPAAKDRDAEIARMLGLAYAKRENYGHVTDQWVSEVAAILLDRQQKVVA